MLKKFSKKQKISFQEKVYKVVKKIPKGKVLTYKEVAQSVGFPQAWRAVGNVLSQNKNPKIPCHRVIKSDGKVGNFRNGEKRKITLLRKEGVLTRN